MSSDLKPVNKTERQWASVIHGSAIAGVLFPLALVLGPLFIWMLKKNDSPYLNTQGKKAINFQLTILFLILFCILCAMLIKPLFALAFMSGIGGLVFSLMASVIVWREGDFEYPFYFRII